MRPKIYLFGDSITQLSFEEGGWGASLANHYSRTADVVLRGYSGYNTRWALKVIEKVFPPPESNENLAAVTVFFGANDAAHPDRYCGPQSVPLEEYRENLHAIVAFLKLNSTVLATTGSTNPYSIMPSLECEFCQPSPKRWPSVRIILITPPPVDEAGRLLNPFMDNPSGVPERTNKAAGSYAKACLAVAAECRVAAIDLWGKMQLIPEWEKACLCDGLHLTPYGSKIVFEEVIEQLKKEQISLSTLPVHLPLIEDMDPKDPLKSLMS